MSDSRPAFDCTSIAFPSDRLSVKDLRQHFPNEFDNEDVGFIRFFRDGHDNSPFGQFLDMLMDERLFAQASFEGALSFDAGNPGEVAIQREIAEEASALRSRLNDAYTAFRICQGPQTCREMIDGIEKAAIEKANKRQMGRST